MFDKLESIFLNNSHGHCGRVNRCIVLVEEQSVILSVFHAECVWSSPVAISEDQHSDSVTLV